MVVAQLAKNFPTIYGKQNSSFLITRAPYWALKIRFKSRQPIYLTSREDTRLRMSENNVMMATFAPVRN
jgi:hypothetical protein